MKRNYGKLITMLLCLTMLLSLFPMTALATDAVEPVAESEEIALNKAIVIPGIGEIPGLDNGDVDDLLGGLGNLPGVVPTPVPEVFSGTCGEAATWKFETASNTLTISGTGAVADYGTNDSPWFEYRSKIKTLVVEDGITILGNNAFRGCQNIITATLPETLESIGTYCFYECRLLEQMEIPQTVTTLGQNAFAYCQSLTKASVPETLTKVPNYLFANCSDLAEVQLPAGITEIGQNAFDGCASLTKINLPEGLTTIGSNAFRNCAALAEIEFPASVTTIRQGAFNGCAALKSFSVPDGTVTVDFLGGCTKLSSVYLPLSVQTIANGTFGESTKLKKVYYGGNKLDWKNITIGENNAPLDEASFLYNCIGLNQTAPSPTPEVTPEGTPGTDPTPEVTPAPTPTVKPVVTPTPTPVAPPTPTPNPELDSETCNHTLFFISPVNPTCYESGLTGKIICGKGCGAVLLEPTVKDKLGHNYKNGACTRCGHKQGTPDVAPTGTPFKDVRKTDWFYQPVLWAVENNVASGTSATTFSPNDACTRAQIVTFLWAAAGKPEPTVAKSPFSDVKNSDWYCKAVLWAVENDITSGISATVFGPNNPCSRAQVATMLYKAKGSPKVQNSENPFSDVKETNYYYNAVLWALENGVASGVSADKFGANQPCTRAQIATFLYKAYSK